VVVAYRNGPGDGDVMFEEADTSGLSWICRRKAAYITKILLMPFTVAFDILTSPIQFIIFCAFYKP